MPYAGARAGPVSNCTVCDVRGQHTSRAGQNGPLSTVRAPIKASVMQTLADQIIRWLTIVGTLYMVTDGLASQPADYSVVVGAVPTGFSRRSRSHKLLRNSWRSSNLSNLDD